MGFDFIIWVSIYDRPKIIPISLQIFSCSKIAQIDASSKKWSWAELLALDFTIFIAIGPSYGDSGSDEFIFAILDLFAASSGKTRACTTSPNAPLPILPIGTILASSINWNFGGGEWAFHLIMIRLTISVNLVRSWTWHNIMSHINDVIYLSWPDDNSNNWNEEKSKKCIKVDVFGLVNSSNLNIF